MNIGGNVSWHPTVSWSEANISHQNKQWNRCTCNRSDVPQFAHSLCPWPAEEPATKSSAFLSFHFVPGNLLECGRLESEASRRTSQWFWSASARLTGLKCFIIHWWETDRGEQSKKMKVSLWENVEKTLKDQERTCEGISNVLKLQSSLLALKALTLWQWE